MNREAQPLGDLQHSIPGITEAGRTRPFLWSISTNQRVSHRGELNGGEYDLSERGN